MQEITIIGGLGNVGSVRNMLARLGIGAEVTGDPDRVRAARKLILPGVGAFDAGVNGLRERGLDEALREAVTAGSSILGICLGMQLLLQGSEEGSLPGLGLVAGRARRFIADGARLRVPHMGWNIVRPTRNSLLFDRDGPEQRFYFVHSYFVECDDPADVVGVTSYGHEFVAALEHGPVLGVQFHAEKSHRFGMALLKRFVAS
jgi:glutamine amidotransferase